ncbi:MAG: RDD family protein [Nocardia sp.]|nr:RDD family protein [Nocardia sp.]
MAPVGVWIAERRRRALRQPWTCWRIQYRRGNYEHVTLIDDQGRAVQTHMLNTWPAMRGRLFDESTTHVWFAGDPLRRGVLSRPGGADLRYCWASTPTDGEVRATLARSAPRDHASRSSPTTTHDETRTPESPPNFGGLGDTRYPSSRTLRRRLAYLTDVAIHLGLAVGIAFVIDAATVPDWRRPDVDPRAVLVAFLAVSFTDRVVLQTFSHTTMGKLFFGLVIVDRDTGRYPRFRWLLGVWVYGLFAWTLVPLECSERPERYFLPAVRRGDMKAAGTSTPHENAPATPAQMDTPAIDFGRPLGAEKSHSTVYDGIIDSNGR